jgi:glycerol-3-phosphate cytidylyltransferase-like family protein
MLRDRPVRWVSGYFDPLLAEHVRRLRECAKPGELLVIEIANPKAPLLPQKARAELVAALAVVDYVVLGDGQPQNEIMDAAVTTQFTEQVLTRHRGEAG